MKVSTAQQMREIDRKAIESGIEGITLMENAAKKVADACIKYLKKMNKKSVIVISGKGNNGGDGFAVSRILNDAGYDVEVIFVGDIAAVKGDAYTNLKKIENLKISINPDIFDIDKKIMKSDVVIDALLGTGIHGEIADSYKTIIEEINQYGKYIISVDIPSGVDADNGSIHTVAVNADETITFALPKTGILLYPGAENAGKVRIEDIDIPQNIIDEIDINCNYLTVNEAANLMPIRRKRSNKGTFGKLIVVAGSKNMTGAAYLTVKSGYRVGAGIVYAATVKSAVSVLQTLIPEAVEIGLDESNGRITENAYQTLDKLIKNADAFVIGPGIGISEGTKRFIIRLLQNIGNKPVLIDADGLNNIISCKSIIRNLNCVITPHIGEMSRLSGKSVREILDNTLDTAIQFSKEYGCVTLLKDAHTVIASPDGTSYINLTGNSGMAKGGSGDVLSGIIGGLIAQGMNIFDSAVLGAYIHGTAGDIAAKKYTQYGILSGEISDFIPYAIKSILKRK